MLLLVLYILICCIHMHVWLTKMESYTLYSHIYIYLPNMSKFLFSEITESLVGLLFGHRHPKVHRIFFFGFVCGHCQL